jgi:hypothetical protein
MVLIANILKQKGNIMARNKYVYVVLAHNTQLKCTYISRICSNKKKAELEREFIQKIMRDDPIVYWTSKERVS